MTDILEFENGRPVFPISIGNMEWNKTGSWRYMRPLYEDKTPSCTVGCPANEKIPQYFALVKEKKYEEAWHIILEDNPLPGVCGRVCYHPCEDVCNRLEFDEPIAINNMERFVADQNFNNSYPKHFYVPWNGKNIAVIGSGPAGLSAAYRLARLGFQVTIYEAQSSPGGMLRIGIPQYRLPREVLDKEINDIKSLGVKIKTNALVGTKISWDRLYQDYDAILIATGAYKNLSMGIPGEQLEGISSGLDFLQEFNLKGSGKVKKKLIVVGGGNTAIDTARSAIRLGADVTIVYRRSRNEMPAVCEEVDAAEMEGVEFQFLTTPVEFSGKHKLKKVRLIKMKLGEPDDSGRRRPIPIKGSEYEIEVDQIMLAVGEKPDWQNLPEGLNESWGHIAVNDSHFTSLENIFACGDVANGPVGTVVDAIATGKKAAVCIEDYLNGTNNVRTTETEKAVKYNKINPDYFIKEERPKQHQRELGEVVRSFVEVNTGITEADVVYEANRCFSCGVCTFCNICLIYCPDVAIISKQNGHGYVINYDFCKGCGLCVEECPRDAMSFDEELKWKTA